MNKWFLLSSLLVFVSCASLPVGVPTSEDSPKSSEYDVLLYAKPMSVRVINEGSGVDVLEQGLLEGAEARYIVSFRIEEVMRGDFTTVKAGGPSRMQQARQAARDGDFLKLLTLDFQDPDQVVEQKWVRVAVQDPEKTFGIIPNEDPEPLQHYLYLKSHGEESANLYVLIYNQWRSA